MELLDLLKQKAHERQIKRGEWILALADLHIKIHQMKKEGN